MSVTTINGLNVPADSETLWRYVDLWKLKSLLESRGLYFVRSDRFTDTWDSALPHAWRTKMQREMCDRPDGGTYTQATWYEEREIPSNPIQCWNHAEHENPRMWREYTSDANSVVIRSDIGRLRRCLGDASIDVMVGLVSYGFHDDLDDPEFVVSAWGDSPINAANPWYVPRFLKRVEYSHETELRLALHVPKDDQPIDPGYNLVVGHDAITTLVDSIRFHPDATLDFQSEVSTLLCDTGFQDVTLDPSQIETVIG